MAKLEGEHGLLYAQVPFASEAFTQAVAKMVGEGQVMAAE